MTREDIHLVLVTGSRDPRCVDRNGLRDDLELEQRKAHETGRTLVVIHGDCPSGADAMADQWCGKLWNVGAFRAAWDGQGRKAGPIRNDIIGALFKFDAVLQYPGPASIGTHDMVRKARRFQR